MRRLLTWLAVAVATAFGALWWVHEGELEEVMTPLPSWNAGALAREAGLSRATPAERDTRAPAPSGEAPAAPASE